jgi:hypothetical protein
MEFVSRENEIFRTLKGLAEQVDFVVVGGYAVTGLGKHRFSVDCDVVIPKKGMSQTETVLERYGYEKDVEKKGIDETYAGEFIRYKKKMGELPVTFDLLVESLVCRTSGASWSFDYIEKHAVETNIGGIEASAKCRVPEKELMVAFKIHSGRRTDVRDIVVLLENSDLNKVLTHLRRGHIDALKKQVDSITTMLNDEKLVDSLKGVFTLTVDVRKRIADAQEKMASLQKALV